VCVAYLGLLEHALPRRKVARALLLEALLRELRRPEVDAHLRVGRAGAVVELSEGRCSSADLRLVHTVRLAACAYPLAILLLLLLFQP
jgi:hypothetical protein